MSAPWRREFDAARDPYTARVVLGLTAAATGGPFQPLDPDLTSLAAFSGVNVIPYRSAADTWSAVTIGTGLTFSGGTLSASAGAGPFQPLDGDLTSLAGASSTNAIYYRSAADTWAPVTVGNGLAFAAGTLAGSLFSSSVQGDVPASGGGTSNFLRADGTWAAPPSSSGFSNVVVQVFTASGTYTPTASMKFCIIECIGGGGGGGAVAGTASQYYVGAGGGSGSYSRARKTAAQIGALQTVTVGAGGNGGTAGANNGSAGNGTSVGILCVATGGGGGQYSSAAQNGVPGLGGSTGAAVGDVVAAGNSGLPGFYNSVNVTIGIRGGGGGSSALGGGAGPVSSGAGAVAGNYGSGGGGAAAAAASNFAGGNGSAGIVIITEFI